MDKFVLNVNPDYGLSDEYKPRVSKVSFGDGYELRRKQGINTVRKTWNPKWTTLSKAEADMVDNFIVSRLEYQAFLWTHPESAIEYKVLCTSYSKTYDAFGNYSVALTLVEDFN